MTPLFTFTSVRQSFLSTSFVPVSTILCGTHTLSHTHTIVCVWVCECACVTHTHTLTHTPAPQTTCLIDTFCAQKKFTFVKLFYQVFKPSWYFFLSTTNLVLLFSHSSIPCWLYLFLFAQKIPKNFVLLVFFGRKNRQTSVLYQTDIVNKVPIFYSLLQVTSHFSFLSLSSNYCISDFSDSKQLLFCIKEDIFQVLYK